MMQYIVYDQREPTRIEGRIPRGEKSVFEANLVEMGIIEAVDTQQALDKARKLGARFPMVENVAGYDEDGNVKKVVCN